jgi:hypothetical protein
LKILGDCFAEKIAFQNLNDYIKKVVEASGIDELIQGKKHDTERKRKVFDK